LTKVYYFFSLVTNFTFFLFGILALAQKKWALNWYFQCVNEEFRLKNCWKKYHFVCNSILFNVAYVFLAFFAKDNLYTSILLSVCFIIQETKKNNIDWKKLILTILNTWEFFDKKLRNRVTKNVTALRSYFAFFISTKKGLKKNFLTNERLV
jgi:hypothetical protein